MDAAYVLLIPAVIWLLLPVVLFLTFGGLDAGIGADHPAMSSEGWDD